MRDAITMAEAAELPRGQSIETINDPNVQWVLESLGYHCTRIAGPRATFERRSVTEGSELVSTRIPVF